MIRILLSSALLFGLGTSLFAQVAARTEQYADFNPGVEDSERGKGWVQVIQILSPELRSEVRGDVHVEFKAPGKIILLFQCVFRRIRHGALHERIEQGNGKSGISMLRAIDHPFANQAGAQGGHTF
jgi:hypothetical protein